MDLVAVGLSVAGALAGGATSLIVRVYTSDQKSAARLLGEVVARLERGHSEAVERIARIEERLRELEVAQSIASTHQAALDARFVELRADFRVTSEKLDTISQLLAAIRTQLDVLTQPRLRPAR